ncbi:gluconokinase [Neorhizobium alkalisoli]|uniref:Gluconokinase n=1 Tax=Neorhizobium alkalisoli TaxID=528178 RepID=A0A561QSP4_9HYPH|nr:gluconokinase [Neorhizobium alkalisoli]TWF53423.1 gluconate kinase (SKI family) [Neorhizobium alkalisoli]
MSGKDVRAVIVMGVSGAGKSSVAELLAKNLGSAFVEGDSLHPKANIDKMAHGIPLTDEDRWPWLDVIGKEIAGLTDQGKSVVATCSSLKRAYRDRLRKAAGGKLYFVFLKGAEDLLSRRMGERKGHFMPAALLQSQLATLESPEGEEGVVTVDIDASIETIVENARSGLDQIMAQ